MEVSDQIQCNIDPDDPSKGQVIYTMNNNTERKGLFVSAYYYRDSDEGKQQDTKWTKTDIYKKGLIHYLKVTESEAFKGWKLLIYIDNQSLHTPITTNKSVANYAMHLEEWNTIAKHPNVIFGVIMWPEYSVGAGDGMIMDNAMIRAFRLKALTDFPEIPVFVRDADTLFENIIKVKTIYDELTAWELTLKNELERIYSETHYQIIIATQPNYHRQWHMHPLTRDFTVGCYAAVTSTLGNIPDCKNGFLWRKCLEYLRTTSKMMNVAQNKRTPSNSWAPTYIGKDEQLLSFVFIPHIFDQIYFYYLEYIQVEGTKIILSDLTPFAQTLLDKGLTRYPSPYITSRGEELLPLDQSAGTKRKDENTVTENTILDPKIIPLSLSKETHELMQTIFRWCLDNSKKGSRTINLKV